MSTPIEIFNSSLKKKGLTILFAESITAGLIASSIAEISGASSILLGSIVTYNKELKMRLLKVKSETLASYSAESLETTREMVDGLANLNFNASIHVAITGAASPATDEYPLTVPVGTIFIVVKYKQVNHNFTTILAGSRNEIREKSLYFTLEKILSVISEN